ncbi:SART3 [Mytilus coruscus]|uniref:SART3 n=1 Tax=Mytilus coruscus TaxID=42192 RepID=A0A6J8BZ03_MYTCO|nr:SART3 [Mytilus coruscus]
MLQRDLTLCLFCRCYGDNKHCRKLLQRALNSVSDWPESIVDAFINFEREEGDLEQYESALVKCNAQMDRIRERRKQLSVMLRWIESKREKKTGKGCSIKSLAKCNAQMDRIKERRKQMDRIKERRKQVSQKKKLKNELSVIFKMDRIRERRKQVRAVQLNHELSVMLRWIESKREENRQQRKKKERNPNSNTKVEKNNRKHLTKVIILTRNQQFSKKDKNTKFDKRQNSSNEGSEKVFVKPYQKKETKHEDTSERISLDEDQKASNGLKRKAEDDQPSESVFKVPPPPGFKGQKSGPPPGYKGKKSEPPPGFKGHKAGVTEPPPGFKGKSSEGEEPPAKVQKTDGDDRLHEGQGDAGPDKSSCTAFVSNLAYDVDEDNIKDTFSQFGEIKDLCVIEALKFDRTPLDGRPVYVSRCEDKSVRKPQFKFATDLEKNKLFIKGLPFTCTKEALSNIFSQHGKLKDVRLVTYRSGAPKGLAYVEYENENEATQAVMKTDGLAIGEHTISVAISCPPDRRPQKDQFIPSLGSGKKETDIRGKARTQVSLLPRALKTGGTASSNEKSSSKSSSAATNEKPGSKEQSGKSNDDFRKMLLGIK